MRIRFSAQSYTFFVSIGITLCLSFYLLISILGYYPPLPGGDDTQFWIYVASGHREATNIWAYVVSSFQVDTPNGLHRLLILLGTIKYVVNPILVVILIQQSLTIKKIKRYGKIGLAYALLYPTVYLIIGGLYRDPLICTLYLVIFTLLCRCSITSKNSFRVKILYMVVSTFTAIILILLRPQIQYIFIISMIYFFSFLVLNKFFKPKSLVLIAAIITLIGVSLVVTFYKDILLGLITSFEGTNDESAFVVLINIPWLGGPLYLAANFLHSFLALNPTKPAYVIIFLFETLPALVAIRTCCTHSNLIIKDPAYLYLVSFIFTNILILSLSCPNTGSSLRYRYPIFMSTVPFSLMLINRHDISKRSSYV